jgi:Fur family ferric uptake transcriptional regulator
VHPATLTSDDVLALVRQNGHRITTAKRAVIGVLEANGEHLTAEEITSLVQQQHADVNASTVYRILEELETLGAVLHSHVGTHAAVFHLAGPLHAHLVCSRCEAVKEIPASRLDALSHGVAEEFGFVLDRHHLALSGMCEACAKVERQTESAVQ